MITKREKTSSLKSINEHGWNMMDCTMMGTHVTGLWEPQLYDPCCCCPVSDLTLCATSVLLYFHHPASLCLSSSQSHKLYIPLTLNSTELQRIYTLQKHGSHSLCLTVHCHNKGRIRDVSLQICV